MKVLAVLIFILEGLVCAELGTSDPVDLSELSKHIPESIKGMTKLPTSIDDIPEDTFEKVEMKFEEKCNKVGGEKAYTQAKNARADLENCVRNLINMTELQQKVEESKPVGKLDEVSREYCQKSPVLKDCIKNFTNAAELCLDQAEKDSVRTTLNVTNAILDFVCHKQGDRIALFIAEGGQDCLNKTQTEIQTCMNSTIGKLVPEDKTNTEIIPQLVLGEKECMALKDMQTCTVQVMESKCSEPTPANIVESMFKFVIKMTPCTKYVSADESGMASSIVATLSLTLASLFTAALLAM